MIHFRFCFKLTILFAPSVLSQATFVHPPDSANENAGTNGANMVMSIGDVYNVQWTGLDSNIYNETIRNSIAMWPVDADGDSIDTPGKDLEYITQNATADTISEDWLVRTDNLAVSSMFRMYIFREGENSPRASTVSFNITSNSKDTTSSAITSSTSSTSINSSATSSQTQTQTPTPTNTPAVVHSTGLSTGAKTGIAIGIIGATLLGAIAAWLIFLRRKVNNPNTPMSELASGLPKHLDPNQTTQSPYTMSSQTSSGVPELNSNFIPPR